MHRTIENLIYIQNKIKSNILELKSYLKNPRSDVNGIFLSTAHPIKFKEEVENSIGEQISLPSRLKKIMTKKKNTIEIESYNELKDHLLCRFN